MRLIGTAAVRTAPVLAAGAVPCRTSAKWHSLRQSFRQPLRPTAAAIRGGPRKEKHASCLTAQGCPGLAHQRWALPKTDGRQWNSADVEWSSGVRFFGIWPLTQPSLARIKQCDKRVSLFFVAGLQWCAADSLPWPVASEVHVSTDSNQAERRILRRADVEARCGFKRAHLYKLIRDGKFPRPLRIGIRAVGWDSVDIDQWIAEQVQRRT